MSKLLPILVEGTGLSELDIRRIAANAPHRYKTYRIPKRSGGYRLISQPAREVKALQRALVDGFLSQLPVHSAATAYRSGASIRANAAAHAANGPILKFDFSDFFPSISADDWRKYCVRHSLFRDPEDVEMSCRVLFHSSIFHRGLRLAIGAPSSPMLSNILMYDFDLVVSEAVSEEQVVYTRYADDLTFSARRTGYLTGVRKILNRAIASIEFPKLTVNADKTVLATKKYKRMVTGLILTNDHKVSIGYARKRGLRAALHNYKYGKLSLREQARLAGMLAFVNAAEPNFLNVLREKYGDELIDALKKLRVSRAEAALHDPVGDLFN